MPDAGKQTLAAMLGRRPFQVPEEALGSKLWPLPHQPVGLEVEVELEPRRLLGRRRLYWDVEPLVNGPSARWEVVGDGSLRGGVELRTITGMCGKHLSRAIMQLKKFFTARREDLKVSYRTSIHAHFYALNLTLPEFARLLCLYVPCEPLLFRWAGHNRDNNIYCVPWHAYSDALEEWVPALFEALSAGQLLRRGLLHPRLAKYSALNLARLTDLGTIEYRHLLTTLDVGRIREWIRILMRLHQAATRLTLQPNELFQHISKDGLEGFLRSALGEGVFQELWDPELEPEVWEGVNVAEHFTLPQSFYRRGPRDEAGPMDALLRKKLGSCELLRYRESAPFEIDDGDT